MTIRSFAIVGAGPTGGVLAAFLTRAGHDVRVADIDAAHIKAMKTDGLRIHGALSAEAVIRQAVEDLARLSGGEPDYLCIATKTSALQAILPAVRSAAGERTVVVAVQNGLDNEDVLAEALPGRPVCRVVVNWAGGLEGPGRIHAVFFHPPNFVGAQSESAVAAAKELAGLMTAASLTTEYTDRIKRYEWEKTLLNGAMSSTAALTGLNMAQVMAGPDSRALVEALIVEGIGIGRAAGVEFDDDILEKSMAYLDTAGPHKPSLAVDLDAGRATEIDFLNGRIVENARRLGLEAPRHETVTRLIRAAEARRRGGGKT